jgi:hypothetical protein
MARLGSLQKLGFYPTPTTIVPLIARHLNAWKQGKYRIYDPCCGDGSALVQLRAELTTPVWDSWSKEMKGSPEIKLYGVELDEIRAAQAKSLFTQVENVDSFLARLSDEEGNPSGAEVLYLNPPYAGINSDGRGEERWETRFLAYTLPFLQWNGILVFVVREPYLVEYAEEVSRILGNHSMSNVKVYRFPEPEYGAYQQVVLFGKRSTKSYSYNFVPEAVLGMGVPSKYNSSLDPIYRYSLPFLGSEAQSPIHIRVTSQQVPVTPMLEETPEQFYEYLGDPNLHTDFQPLMEMKDTLAVLVASGGMLNGVEVDEKLLRGDSYKIETLHTETRKGDSGYDIKEEWTIEEMVHRLTLLDLCTGAITEYSSHSEFAQYQQTLIDYLPDILRVAYQLYPPLYQDADFAKYSQVLSTVPSPKKLVNRRDGGAGLLPAQAQRAAAFVHGWKHGLQVLTLIGEMSSGKTICSLSGAMLYGAHRIIIFCPAEKDVRMKWLDEIKGILGPLGWKAVLATTVSSIQDAFSCASPTVIVLPETTAKLSSGWTSVRPTIKWRYAWVPYDKYGELQMQRTARQVGISDSQLEDVLYPICRKVHGEPSKAFRYKACYVCEACGKENELSAYKGGSVRSMCRYCSEPFWQATPSKRIARNSFGDFDQQVRAFKASIRALSEKEQKSAWKLFRLQGDEDCGTRKVALAQYVADHYARQYVLIIDEAHETKSGSAARSIAAQDLMAVADRTLQMTGTIFGGKASSLFYLLYRSSPSFRKMYAFDEVQRFVNMYGLSQTVKKFYPQFTDSRTFNGYREIEGSPNEKEGIHPGMAALLLPYSLYITLADLAFAMPEREQFTLYTPFPQSFEKVTSRWLNSVKDQAVLDMRDGNMSTLAQWQQARFRVLDCPDMPDVIAGKKYVPLDEWKDTMLPKEEALLRLLWQEKQQKRKCLMFVQQPHRGDPTPRLFRFMEEYGMKGAMMKSDVKDRLDFIRDSLKAGCDVVVTSVPLVRQSIDIPETPTIIHFGVSMNVYMIPQANARPYRLTQEQKVKIYYMAHQSSVQAAVWDVVANKLAASSMLQGDPVQGLASLKGESSFARTMVDMVVDKMEYSSDLTMEDLPPLPRKKSELLVVEEEPLQVLTIGQVVLQDPATNGALLDVEMVWAAGFTKIYLPRSVLSWAKKLNPQRQENVLNWGLCPNCRMEFDGRERFKIKDGYRYHFNCA